MTSAIVQPTRRQAILRWAVILAIAFGSAMYLYRMMPWGIGVFHDSLFYLTTAQSIVGGTGVYWLGSSATLKPLTHFPPMYPTAVAAVAALGLEVADAARLVSSLLYGLNVALVGAVIQAFTRRILLSLLGMGLVLISPVVLQAHLLAMSEPLFYLASFAGLALLSSSMHNRRKSHFLGAAALFAVAFLTRYVASSLILASMLAILIFDRRRVAERLGAAFAFGAVSGLPSAVWLIRNFSLAGSFTNRAFGVHPISTSTVGRVFDVLASWFLPQAVSHWLEALVMAAVAGALLLFVHWQLKDGFGAAPILMGRLLVYAFCYVFFILVSLSFFDASIPIDDRTLSPLWIVGVLVLGLAAHIVLQRMSRGAAVAMLIGSLLLVPRFWSQSRAAASQMRNEGVGFTARSWQESEVIDWISQQEDHAVIFTNEAMAVQFITEHAARQTPSGYDPVKGETREGYVEAFREMRSSLGQRDSYLVLFSMQATPEVLDLAGEALESVLSDGVGTVYAHPSTLQPPEN